MTIWRMRIAFWIPNTTNTHSEYLILIAFPLQPLLQERSSVSCYTYIACLVDSWCNIVESATLTMHQRGRFKTMGNLNAKIDAVECGHGPKKRGWVALKTKIEWLTLRWLEHGWLTLWTTTLFYLTTIVRHLPPLFRRSWAVGWDDCINKISKRTGSGYW
jgi:hypothetical protein